MRIDIISGTIVFIFGMMIGSFLNVVIYRVPKKISLIKPDSMCPACGRPLKWYDLFPVFSYIFLMGKCRYCKARISPRYSIVELITAVMSVMLCIKYGFTFEFVFYLALLYILIPCFFIDLEHMIIPNGLIITGLAVFVTAFLYEMIFKDTLMLDNIFGGLAGGGIFLLIYIAGLLVYKKEALGFGDVKLFFMTGLFLGLKETAVAFLFSVFIGALAGLLFMAAKKKNAKAEMPFGPFIVIGSVLSIYIGDLVYNWYMGFFA